MDGAKALCQECLNHDVSYGDAHLLMAKISLSENNHRQAIQSLEIGLSYNFELMESPLYHYVQVGISQSELYFMTKSLPKSWLVMKRRLVSVTFYSQKI